METGAMLLWFNPMVGRYKRSMKIQHEYLADAFTLGKGVSTPGLPGMYAKSTSA